MNIGEAAALSGLPAKTIRYYEEIGLVRPAVRAANGYRAYAERDVRILMFLHRARCSASASRTAGNSSPSTRTAADQVPMSRRSRSAGSATSTARSPNSRPCGRR